MKTLLKIVAAIILLLLIAITVFVFFVDPNQYRGYLVNKVEQSTGYKLAINGELSWYIWPKVSILVNDVTVTAPGAKESIAHVQNMRLDLELLPLLSKKIEIDKVVLQNAEIQITDESLPTAKKINDNSQAQSGNNSVDSVDQPTAEKPLNLSKLLNRFSLPQIDIFNSRFVLLRPDNLLILDDINISLWQAEPLKFNLKLASKVDVNTLQYTVDSESQIDLSQLAEQIVLNLTKFNYRIINRENAQDEIKGDLTLNLNYQQNEKQLNINKLEVSVNNNHLAGEAILKLATKTPHFSIQLSADALNLDTLNLAETEQPVQPNDTEKTENKNSNPKDSKAEANELSFLRYFDGDLSLKINKLNYKKQAVDNVSSQLENKQGKVEIKAFSALWLGGTVNISGTVNATGKKVSFQLMPSIANLSLDKVAESMNKPSYLSGIMQSKGTISGNGLSSEDRLTNWTASFPVQVDNARLNNLNLQQIIQRLAMRSSKATNIEKKYQQYTELQNINTTISLRKGKIYPDPINVNSKEVMIKGNGEVDPVKEYCNIQLYVKLQQGVEGSKKLVETLKKTFIPIKLYGSCDNLNYQIQFNDILKEQLREQGTKLLDKYLNKNSSDSEDNSDKEKISKTLSLLEQLKKKK